MHWSEITQSPVSEKLLFFLLLTVQSEQIKRLLVGFRVSVRQGKKNHFCFPGLGVLGWWENLEWCDDQVLQNFMFSVVKSSDLSFVSIISCFLLFVSHSRSGESLLRIRRFIGINHYLDSNGNVADDHSFSSFFFCCFCRIMILNCSLSDISRIVMEFFFSYLYMHTQTHTHMNSATS